MTNIPMNDELLSKIVRAVDKAVSDDIPQVLRENFLETNNHILQHRGDYINENLRRLVVSEGVDLLPFKRNGWHGRIIIDRQNKATYSITTQRNLRAIPRKKGRINPHFLHSILAIENGKHLAKERQLGMFPIKLFDERILKKDFSKIFNGELTPLDGYQHYIISYKTCSDVLTDIRLEFLDKNFDIIDRLSLNKYIKPDFARITNQFQQEPVPTHSATKTERDLIAIRPGVYPKIKEMEDEA